MSHWFYETLYLMPDPSGRAPTKRRPRLTDAETAERMLTTACDQLDTEGVTVGFENISMERVIAEADVSRASAYRRWPTRHEFLTDVLVAAVSRTPLPPETEADILALHRLVASYRDRLLTAQGRRDLIVRGLQLASDADIRRLLASRRWQNHLALAATHRGLPDGELKTSVGRAIAAAERRMLDRRAEVYEHLPALLGYRLVPPLKGSEGFRVMSSAAGVMMTGILLRSHADPSWLDERMSLQPFGTSEPADWSLPEFHLVGAFLSHFEPDPDVTWDDERLVAALRLFDERAAAARGSL